jgi:DNA-binding PadR family transcriptional regulator
MGAIDGQVAIVTGAARGLARDYARRFAEAADLPSLYRSLRGLECEGFVRSRWELVLGRPARRTYEITPSGRRLVGQWAEALQCTRSTIDQFLERYEAEVASAGEGGGGKRG